MNNITRKITVDQKYKTAKEAIKTMEGLVRKNTNPNSIVTDVYLFEDIMNGLSGDILGFAPEQYNEIVELCTSIVDAAAKKNITISLYEKLLKPKPKTSKREIEVKTAKKLYPLTTSVKISKGSVFEPEEVEISSTIPESEKNIKRLLDSALERVQSSSKTMLSIAAKAGIDSDVSNAQINNAIIDVLLNSGGLSQAFLADLVEYSKDGIKDDLTQIQNISNEELNNLISALSGKGVVDFTGDANGIIGNGGLVLPGSVVAGAISVGGFDLPSVPTPGAAAAGVSVGSITFSGNAAVGQAAAAGDDFDPNFDLLDEQTQAEATNYEQTPLVLLSDESEDYLPLIPEELRDLVEGVATNSAGLQTGLASFFTNPLAGIIEDTRNLLLTYTDNNFQGLNAAVGGAATGTAYGIFQDALGGGDGLGGAVAQLDAFKDHTDRLSGLVLDSSSEHSEPSSDNTIEDKFCYDVPVNTKTALLTFNAKKFRSAKYYVQSTAALGTSLSANTEHQTTELFVLHDNRKVYFREVFTNYTIDPFSTFTAELVGGNVVVSITSTLANTNHVIHGVKLRIAANTDSYERMSLVKILRTHYELDLFYDEDGEYASEMAGSLFKRNLVENLYTAVYNSVRNVSSGGNPTTAAVSVKAATAAIQASIDTDYTAYKNYSKIAETLNMVSDVQQFYLVPSTRPILDLILNTTIKSTLETEVDTFEDLPEEPDIELELDQEILDEEAEE